MTRTPPRRDNAPPARPPRPVTTAYLERAALAYLERYACSVETLARALRRKVERRCRPRGEDAEPLLALVDEVVEKARESGLVDDRRFAEGRIASLRRRGGSARAIGAKLAAKGVQREVIAAALAGEEGDELAAAHALARRRKLGPYRAGERASFRQKDLAALARAGFAFGIAREVIDSDPV